MKHPERIGVTGRLLVGVLLATSLAGGTVACGETKPEPEVLEIVVPAGTAERLARGEEVRVMPSVLRFRVGDTLRIRNEDSVPQSVGPYQVMAGGEFSLTYGAPGRFEGICPLSEGDTYEIIVTE